MKIPNKKAGKRLQKNRVALYFLAVLCSFVSCGKREIPSCGDTPGLYALSAFPIGVAVEAGPLRYNPSYREIAARQFNSITPENAFKAASLFPAPGTYHWEEADQIVQFSEENHQRLHGHTLVWHRQLPGWIENFEASPSQWETLFKEYIQTVCSHFRGKVAAWDVVNEAFNDDGTLRATLWKEKIGASYIEKAFRYAQEADPEALLFYNDYDIAANPVKRKAVLDFLEDLKQRGVPVHGVGMQMHISVAHPENRQISEAFHDIYRRGFRLHVSELDISVNPRSRDEISGDWQHRQALKLASVTSLYRSVPARYRYGMTFWGVSDAHTWLREAFQRKDYPLLYDDEYRVKPAYCKLREIL